MTNRPLNIQYNFAKVCIAGAGLDLSIKEINIMGIHRKNWFNYLIYYMVYTELTDLLPLKSTNFIFLWIFVEKVKTN